MGVPKLSSLLFSLPLLLWRDEGARLAASPRGGQKRDGQNEFLEITMGVSCSPLWPEKAFCLLWVDPMI